MEAPQTITFAKEAGLLSLRSKLNGVAAEPALRGPSAWILA